MTQPPPPPHGAPPPEHGYQPYPYPQQPYQQVPPQYQQPPPPPPMAYAPQPQPHYQPQPPQAPWGAPPPPPAKKGPGAGLLIGGTAAVLVVVAVIVTLVITLTGKPPVNPVITGPSGEPAVGTNDAVLKIGISAPLSLLPGNAGYEQENTVLTALYAGLTRTDATTGMPVNRLAESITTTDSTVWTIKLRPGYTFHNGEPVTAKSFVDAWNFAADEVNDQFGAYAFQRIAGFAEAQKAATTMSGLQVLDDRTFTVTLTGPWAAFPTALAMPVWSPMAPACLANTTACDDRPIGNGPFQLSSGSRNGDLKLTRWDAFAGAKPQFGGIDVTYLPDPSAGPSALASGSVDFIRQGPGAAPTTAVTKPTGSFMYLGFPTDKNGYASPELRRAVSLAIDREAIAKAIGGLTPATSFTPTGMPGHKDGSCSDCRHDQVAAKTAFTQSGWDVKTPLEFQVSQYNQTALQYMTLVCNDVTASLGVQCKVTPTPSTEFAGKLADHGFTGGWASGWIPDQACAEAYLTPLYGKGNYFGYADPAFDQTLATANAMNSLETALPLYQQAEALLNAGMPVVPIAYKQYVAAIGERVVPETVVVDPASEAPQWDLMKVRK
ncbi:hypothetical protein Afil01_40920 [Actinorhabdospora filicis]|uniref:Solute-binding protein family 5 domain-containing protein n=1 Tax=Actinorhabdospora filicis TaxID=1785913 RepID=A0A9W6SLS3_9ACTN|nr:ABC transporter substrate-binding protein [Actinorhabdospora filicis]GLZ79285.1 hypothetical protein Afil01_40920 [Actinorhabdospora filicis]